MAGHRFFVGRCLTLNTPRSRSSDASFWSGTPAIRASEDHLYCDQLSAYEIRNSVQLKCPLLHCKRYRWSAWVILEVHIRDCKCRKVIGPKEM
jgi:hypothetical protein